MSSETAAVLVKASGHVYVERGGTRTALAEGDAIRPTDTLLTDSQSTAEVRFEDGSTATLSPGSTLVISEFAFGGGQEPSFVLNLAQGAMRSVSGGVVRQNPEAFKIVTPKATVGIRGTELFNSVQENQEVHAVLLIGKGHVVVVTGNDGATATLTAALQGVTLDSTGVMVKQVYTLQELESVIRELAPTQLQPPLNPGGDADDGKEVEQPGSAEPPLSIILLYEQPDAGNSQEGEGSSALFSGLSQLMTMLSDEGFSITSLDSEGFDDLLVELDLPKLPGSTVRGGGDDAWGASATDSTTQDNPMEPPADNPEPPVPPAPPEPSGPQPLRFVFAGDLPAGWGLSHLDDLDPAQALDIAVSGNVLEDVPLNALLVSGGMTGGDTMHVDGALVGAALSGDAETLGMMGRALLLADIETGNDVISVGTVDAHSKIFGDAREIMGGASVKCGDDAITVGTLAGSIYGDVEDPLGVGDLSYGNDTLVVGTLQAGGAVYGDAATASDAVCSGGDDEIHITLMQGGTVNGGIGLNTITISTMQGGVVEYGGGTNTMDVTAMSGGTLYGNAGDTLHVSNLNGGLVETNDGVNLTVDTLAGSGQINIKPGSSTLYIASGMNGGEINIANALDSFAVGSVVIGNAEQNNAIMSGGTISGGSGKSAITVHGDFSGGSIMTGSDADRVHITGDVSGGSINLGSSDNTLTIDGVLRGGTLSNHYHLKVGTLDGPVTVGGSGSYEFGNIINGTVAPTWSTSVTVSGAMQGGELSGQLNTVQVARLEGGTIKLTSNSTLNVADDMTGGRVEASAAGANVTIAGTMSDGVLDGDYAMASQNFTVGALQGSAMVHLGGNDALVVSGDMMGGLITTPTNSSTITIQGTLLDGLIDATSTEFGTSTININNLAGGKISGGINREVIDVANLIGATTIDFGLDELADSLTIDRFLQGSLVLDNVGAEDKVALGMTNSGRNSVGFYSQNGDTFTITYASGGEVHISGAVVGVDAEETLRDLLTGENGPLTDCGSLFSQPVLMSEAEFQAAFDSITPGASSAIEVVGSLLVPASYALNGSTTTLTNDDGKIGDDYLGVANDMGVGVTLSGDLLQVTVDPDADCRFGHDFIDIRGTFNGTLYGDAESLQNNGSVTFGNDVIKVGTLAGGTLYGDAGIVNNAGTLVWGNDSIVIDRLNLTANAVIDAGGGADTINLNSMLNTGEYTLTINLGADADADSVYLGSKQGGGENPVKIVLSEFHREDSLSMNQEGMNGTFSQTGGTAYITYSNGLNLELTGSSVQSTAQETYNALLGGQLSGYGNLVLA